MQATHSPSQNRLLGALPETLLQRLQQHLELTDMAQGDVLYTPGSTQTHVYFPITCVISIMYAMEDDESAETAMVGNEGLIGVALFLGGDTTPGQAVVQTAGLAYRLKARCLADETGDSGPVLLLLLRYAQALMTQMAQTAVCNRHHSVEQQLCRWLLASLDRLPSNELHSTHELIARMLGVRRGGVTEAAGNLQRAGLIRYSRGRITVLDRPQLEQEACECYSVVKKEFDRLLPALPQATASVHRRW